MTAPRGIDLASAATAYTVQLFAGVKDPAETESPGRLVSYFVIGADTAPEASTLAEIHIARYLEARGIEPARIQVSIREAIRHERRDSAKSWLGYDFVISEAIV